MKLFNIKNRLPLIIAIICLFALPSLIFAIPQYNIQDPAIIHTIMGTDKYYKARKHAELSWHISPFFQHCTTASPREQDPTGAFAAAINNTRKNKVPIGNIYGRWNMFALFYNDARPTDQAAAFPNLDMARTTVMDLTPVLGSDFTQESNFNPDCNPCALVGTYKAVEIEYEKIGLRSKLAWDFAFGLGFSIKTGLISYKQSSRFILDDSLACALPNAPEEGSAGLVCPGGTGTANASPSCSGLSQNPTAAGQLCENLMGSRARRAIARELCINLDDQCVTGLEDLHVNLYWQIPFECCFLIEGCKTNIVPYAAVGAWLPTGLEKNQDKVFSLPTGNNGFTALTIDANITFDFPKMIQIAVGGGAAVFMTRDLCNQRVPTSIFQVGLVPWKTDIRTRPGAVWYGNVSLKADIFIPDFSFYFDYVYTEHLKDKVTLKGDDCSPDGSKFLPHILELQSKWKIQNFNFGLRYDFSKHCAVGLGVQGTITGEQVYRPTTVIGSVILTF